MWVRCRHPVSCTSTDSWEPFGTAHSLGTRIHLHGTSTTSRGLKPRISEFNFWTVDLVSGKLCLNPLGTRIHLCRGDSPQTSTTMNPKPWNFISELFCKKVIFGNLCHRLFINELISNRKLKLMPGLNHLQSSQQAQAALVLSDTLWSAFVLFFRFDFLSIVFPHIYLP